MTPSPISSLKPSQPPHAPPSLPDSKTVNPWWNKNSSPTPLQQNRRHHHWLWLSHQVQPDILTGRGSLQHLSVHPRHQPCSPFWPRLALFDPTSYLMGTTPPKLPSSTQKHCSRPPFPVLQLLQNLSSLPDPITEVVFFSNPSKKNFIILQSSALFQPVALRKSPSAKKTKRKTIWQLLLILHMRLIHNVGHI